ncbi:hypothetical protein, partial [Borrelia sp. A-FGy1]|uniref:hypothetical protein n=1 Tax=Borrelia sp. A-FGy1 TaxID=2608247 RepID=UPI001E2F2A2D
FIYKTTYYEYILICIYNKYTRHYNTINTYGSCNTYRIGCFYPGPSAERRQAITDLGKLKLEEEYNKLSKMLKEAVPDYETKTLDDAIAEYKKAIDEASDAEGKIETINDYKEPNDKEKQEKKVNVDHLKKVRNVLPVIEKTMETASKAYADAFAIIASRLSSSEFRQAVSEFNDAAKQYANGKGDNAVSVIVGPISSMTYVTFENGFARAKIFARNYTGSEVEKMIAAIDKLLDVYKKVTF